MTSRLEGGQEYMARADSWDLSENRKGNVELVVNFKVVVEPEERDEAGKITKKAQYEWLNFQRLYFTELSWKRSVQSLIYMGWTGDDLSELRDNGGGLDANEVSITTELSPEYVDEKGNRRPPGDPRQVDQQARRAAGLGDVGGQGEGLGRQDDRPGASDAVGGQERREGRRGQRVRLEDQGRRVARQGRLGPSVLTRLSRRGSVRDGAAPGILSSRGAMTKQQPVPLATQRLYSWCLETRIFAPRVDAAVLRAASASFLGAGRAKVWLVDASQVDEYDSAALGELRSVIADLASRGLEQMALVDPRPAVTYAAPALGGPIRVAGFGTRAEAIGWLKAGCPW